MSAFSDMIRNKAKAEGWSEDFARFSDAQVDAWAPSWDEGAGRFRSEGGGGALVEKPTECPHGTTLHGSKCISWEQANQMFGGGYGPGPAAQPAAVAQPWGQTASPLTNTMSGLLPQGMDSFKIPETGGMNLGEILAPYMNQPFNSATGSLLGGTLTQPTFTNQSQALLGGTGWSAGQNGLQQMMTQRQGKPYEIGFTGDQQTWWA